MNKKVIDLKGRLAQLKKKIKTKNGKDRGKWNKNIAQLESEIERYSQLEHIQKRSQTIEIELIKITKKILDFEVERFLIHDFREGITITKKWYNQKQKEYDLYKNNGDKTKVNKVFNEMQDISEKQKEFRKNLADTIRKIKRTALRLADEQRLTDVEKKLIQKDKKYFANVKRMLSGIEKQRKDFKSGWHDLALEISKGNDDAVEQVEKNLEKFIQRMTKLYGWRLKIKMWKFDDGTKAKSGVMTHVYEAMFDASKNWKKNKYLSVEEWFKGRIKRLLNDVMIEVYQRNERETVISKEQIEEFSDSTGGKIDEMIDKEIQEIFKEKTWFKKKTLVNKKVDSKNKIWIKEASRRVGVCAETLRNWDKKGMYSAKWQEIKGKQYRYYIEEDISELIKINLKGKNPNKYRPKSVAKVLGITERTLKRWEKNESIPRPKRDSKGRFYTDNEIVNIFQIKNIKIK